MPGYDPVPFPTEQKMCPVCGEPMQITHGTFTLDMNPPLREWRWFCEDANHKLIVKIGWISDGEVKQFDKPSNEKRNLSAVQ